MDVYINDEKIDFSLQGESTAGDVVKGIHTWLGTVGFGAFAIHINHGDILLDPYWSSMPVASIDTIHISSAPLTSLRRDCVQSLATWSAGVHGALESLSHGKGSVSTLLGLIGQYPEQEASLAFLTEYDPAPVRMLDHSVWSVLRQHIADLGRDDGSFNSESLPGFAPMVWQLSMILTERMREIDSPLAELQKTARAIKELMGDLGSVGIMLQTGKEKEAYNRIFTFSEVLGKIIRLFWLIAENKTQGVAVSSDELKSWNQDAARCLEGIREAMDHADTVMIGDLLEYELPPVVEQLLSLIPGGE